MVRRSLRGVGTARRWVRGRWFSVLAGTATALVAPGAQAQTAYGHRARSDESVLELSLEELLEVRVRSSSFVMAGERQPVSVTVIDRERIALSGARTLQDVLLAFVPGYFLVEDQDDVIAGFRGFSPDSNGKVMLLLDGRNMNTEWFLGPPDAILNGLDVGYIERIEVSRGPGSVLLGQSSLLGVVNIITRGRLRESYARADVAGGQDDYWRVSMQGGPTTPDASAWFYASMAKYGGQELRHEGWPLQVENPEGLLLIDRGHRLRRARQSVVLARVQSGGLQLRLSRFDQTRDAYNFYRDREEIDQQLMSVGVAFSHRLGKDVALDLDGAHDQDEFGWLAHKGLRMAGTREDRWAGRALLTWNDRALGNKLAVGAELRRFEMGKRDRFGLNLIVNNRADRLSADNDSHRFVQRQNLHVVSLFAEDAWTIHPWVAMFGGLRMDAHPNWGVHFSPRIGTWLTPVEGYGVRLSYQSGFRGAPGMHYAGGWRQDGFLQETSFGDVEANPLVAARGFGNIEPTKPETIRSLELETVAALGEALTFNSVLFVNWLHDLIDVGVITDPSFAAAPPEQRFIGNDPMGDWEGWWFFKNNPGTMTSVGAELSLRFSRRWADITLSHALVRLLDVSEGLENSMYVAGSDGSPHFKAYPENVTRLNTILRPVNRLALGANVLFFSRWTPPASATGGASTGDPGLTLSTTARYRFDLGLDLTLAIRNLVRTTGLWPMNSNAGDRFSSAGTPALEGRTYWVAAGYEF